VSTGERTAIREFSPCPFAQPSSIARSPMIVQHGALIRTPTAKRIFAISATQTSKTLARSVLEAPNHGRRRRRNLRNAPCGHTIHHAQESLREGRFQPRMPITNSNLAEHWHRGHRGNFPSPKASIKVMVPERSRKMRARRAILRP